jgi:outer membrane protein assembly factor BamB
MGQKKRQQGNEGARQRTTACALHVVAVIALLGSFAAQGARAQFVPGHIFVADPSPKLCSQGDVYGWDRIWEVDPETGQSWLFKTLRDEWCGSIGGLAFTPDGTRLLAGNDYPSRILSLDSVGNVEVAYTNSDGVRGPTGRSCITFDAKGGLFVANIDEIIRFPAGGGPAELYADTSDGLGAASGPIAVAADGDVYFGNYLGAFSNFLRLNGVHASTVFEVNEYNEHFRTVTTDACGHVFAGLDTGAIFVYDAGQPSTRRLLYHDFEEIRIGFSLALSPNQKRLYIAGHRPRVQALDLRDGTMSLVADVTGARRVDMGMVVVPVPIIFGDVDRDGTVNPVDLSEFVGEYEGVRASGLMLPCSPADLNHDGAVDLQDVALFWQADRSK